MEGGSITAPGGTLKVVATDNPSLGVGTTPAGEIADPNARIRIHAGTSIDLSGSDYELPMSANLLAIQLRSNELADDPTQRGGALQGKTVYVDVRTGTSIVGKTALQAAELAVPHTIGFWTDTGGTASFQSKGDVVLEQGASINVSGGQTDVCRRRTADHPACGCERQALRHRNCKSTPYLHGRSQPDIHCVLQQMGRSGHRCNAGSEPLRVRLRAGQLSGNRPIRSAGDGP